MSERWQLMRVWHCEALDIVVGHSEGVHFTRTSYISTPPYWRKFPDKELSSRIEQLMNAAYRRRNASMRTDYDRSEMRCFAFYFEWVERDDVAANPDALSQPWLLPLAAAHPDVTQRGIEDIDKKVQAARRGTVNRGYEDAFHYFEIDAMDVWHIVDGNDQKARLDARHAH